MTRWRHFAQQPRCSPMILSRTTGEVHSLRANQRGEAISLTVVTSGWLKLNRIIVTKEAVRKHLAVLGPQAIDAGVCEERSSCWRTALSCPPGGLLSLFCRQAVSPIALHRRAGNTMSSGRTVELKCCCSTSPGHGIFFNTSPACPVWRRTFEFKRAPG